MPLHSSITSDGLGYNRGILGLKLDRQIGNMQGKYLNCCSMSLLQSLTPSSSLKTGKIFIPILVCFVLFEKSMWNGRVILLKSLFLHYSGQELRNEEWQ